jgi:hypothetical protein
MAYLTVEGATITSIAEKHGRSREAVRRCLEGADYEALKRQVFEQATQEARDTLNRAVPRAARLWAGKALDVAAARGDSKPAERLLESCGVIERTNSAQGGIQIFVGVKVADD